MAKIFSRMQQKFQMLEHRTLSGQILMSHKMVWCESWSILPLWSTHLNTWTRWCFLMYCTSLFPGVLMCRHSPFQEKVTVLLSLPARCFWQDLPQSKGAASWIAEPAVLCCQAVNAEEEDLFSLFVSPVAAVLFHIAWSEPEAVQPAVYRGSCCLLMDGPVGSPPLTQALAHPSLWGSAQLYFGIKLPAGKIFSYE